MPQFTYCVTVQAFIYGDTAVVLFYSRAPCHCRQSVIKLIVTHACYTNYLLFDCKDSLLYRGGSPCPQRQVTEAYKSATCNLSLRIKARTEHACQKTSEFFNVHARLPPFDTFIYSRVVPPSLYCCAPHHSEASQGLSPYRHPWLMATGCYRPKMTVCRNTDARELPVRAAIYRG